MTREKIQKKEDEEKDTTRVFFLDFQHKKPPLPTHQEVVLFDANFVLSNKALLSSTRQREEEEEEEHVLCCFYIRTLKQSASVLHF